MCAANAQCHTGAAYIVDEVTRVGSTHSYGPVPPATRAAVAEALPGVESGATDATEDLLGAHGRVVGGTIIYLEPVTRNRRDLVEVDLGWAKGRL